MDTASEQVKSPRVVVNKYWCKSCGICVLLCPQGVLQIKRAKAYVYNETACTSCKTCELHCPDYAITVGGNGVD